jgi:SPP1 family predicted phage head-tail adaptor
MGGNNLKRFGNKSLSTNSRGYAYIQSCDPTRDGRGNETKEWTNTSEDPHSMDITSLSASQIEEYRSQNVEATHLIKIRGEIVISELNRIETIEGKIYEVLTAEDIQERGIVWWVTCKERRS